MFAFVIVAQKNFVVRSFSDVVFFGGGVRHGKGIENVWHKVKTKLYFTKIKIRILQMLS